MNFSSTRRDMQALLTSGFYKVPRFQRPYSWTREELEELWSDVIIAKSSGHFVGSIVVFELSDGHYGVVDGQQRLITVTILLCCIRDALHTAGHSNLANGLHASLIERHDLSNEPKCVLEPETSAEFFYETVQQNERSATQSPSPTHAEEHNLQTAYGYLEDKVTDAVRAIQTDTTLSDDAKDDTVLRKLQNMRDLLLRLSVILLELRDEDDAYIMFETLNARGKDLRVSDLVKNHLAKHLRKKTATVDTFRTRWEKLVAGIEGSSASITVDEFIHHHWLSSQDYTSQKKLFKSIKKTIRKSDADVYLKQLVRESGFYCAMFEPLTASWKKEESEIRRSLRALQIFGVRQPAPFVLALMSELRSGSLKPRQVIRALRAVEVFHFQFTAVASQSSSGGISQMYAKHAREVRETGSAEEANQSIGQLKNKLRERLPLAEEFDAGFGAISYSSAYTRQRTLVRYILGSVTRYGLGTDSLAFEEMTIEHVIPESDESASDETIANIGNLVLVSRSLNEKLGNRPFRRKKKLLESASDVWLDELLCQATEWRETGIGDRAASLAKLSRDKIWRL